MTSLFVSFDMNHYVSCMIFLFVGVNLIFSNIYKINSNSFFFMFISMNLINFFLSLKSKYFNKSSIFLFMTLLYFTLMINFLSVFSFNFPLTSQISWVLFSSLIFWLSFMIFILFNNLKGFLSHLIPEGTPIILIIFLFLIEFISNMIRPLTLTIRLVANILAGHLLMKLLSFLIFYYFLTFPFYLLLNLVELLVALIQSYIFTTMIVLYFSEI